MANYNYATFPTDTSALNGYQPTYPTSQTGTPVSGIPTPQRQFPYQYFPQPQGAVYMIQTSSDVNNIPITNGLSASICLPDATMFIKTMQGGNPSMIGYKLIPLDNQMSTAHSTSESTPKETTIDQSSLEEKLSKILKSFDERLTGLEQSFSDKKGDKTEWQL